MNREQAVEELKETFTDTPRDGFPNISIHSPESVLKTGIKVIKPCTSTYNCYGYALRVFNKWIHPDDFSYDEVDGMFLITARYKFVHIPVMDFDFNPNVRKVVFYAKEDRITHAALRVEKGWKSKLGRCCLIFHPTLELIADGIYGEPAHMFQREMGR